MAKAGKARDRDNSHFFTKPTFEVFFISTQLKEDNLPDPNPFLDGNPCLIHGTVRVVNEDGKFYEFYNRTTSDPETLIPGDKISLCAFPILPYKLLRVVVNLYDLAHDAEIANGCFEIDYSEKYEYDKVYTEHVQGKYGHASVHFSTFQHAIIAFVEKVVLHNDAAASSLSNNLLFGTVAAQLERKFGKIDGNIDDEFPLVALFNNQRKAKEFSNEQAELNGPIKLFRSYVAVPFYCSLKIGADFLDKTDTRIDMSMEFNVYPERLNKESVQGHSCEMQIKVSWLDCYDRLPSEFKVCDDPTLGQEESQELSSKAQQSSLCISRRQPHVSIPMLPSFAEVFTVFICTPDDNRAMRGKVEILDHKGSFCIFRGKERCSGQKSLPIVGLPHNINAKFFGVNVNITDKRKRVISQGFFQWNDRNDNSFFHDKRICSIIMGDIGYVAVHYSMFEYSLKATTRVSFISKSNPQAFVEVSGSIRAEYGQCEYSTRYDQQYYKSYLFSSDDYVQVGLISGSTLPLLKSVISVPVDKSLILDLNLRVMGPHVNEGGERIDDADNLDQEVVVNKLLEFDSNVDGYFIYKGNDYIISLCVEWSTDNMKAITRPDFPHRTWLQKVLQKASTTA